MRFLNRLFTFLAIPVLVGAVQSCAAEGDGAAPGDEHVAMSFRMITSAPLSGSRADALHPEADSEFIEFEDGINMNDFSFFIFVGDGKDARLLVENHDIFQSTDPSTMITGSPGGYTVTVKIDREWLEAVTGHQARPASDDPVNFRFLLFANCYSPAIAGNPAGGGRFPGSFVRGTTTYQDVINAASQWGFDMDEIFSDSQGDSRIAGLYKGNMPMFGTNDFSATEKVLYASRPDDRIYLGEIDLLRALAKVRVVDNIPENDKDASGYPRISSAEIVSSQRFSRPLPYDAVDYVNGKQVHSPNIFSTEDLSAGNPFSYKLGYLPAGWGPVSTGKNVRIGYIPEQKIAHINGNVAEGMPVFRVVVDTGLNADGSIEQETYEIPMTGYRNYEFDFGSDILRNHIYTLSVDRVRVGVDADISLTVSDWVPSSLTLDYTENVNISDVINWTQDTFESNDVNNGVLVFRPWHDGKPVEAVCSFGISTPVGATWTASVPVTEGSPGAFMFIDADGNLVPVISGTIDGKTLTTLRIVPAIPTPSENSTGTLVVTVALANGRFMEARVCDASKGYKNYTVVQNRQ